MPAEELMGQDQDYRAARSGDERLHLPTDLSSSRSVGVLVVGSVVLLYVGILLIILDGG